MSFGNPLLIGLLATSLSACTLVEVKNDDVASRPVVEEKVRETNNITYVGVVQPAGISIYQQGSHRLSLAGGKFVLLESESLDLNGYVNEKVQIFGALRPTIEAGGMIMRVERIELLTPKEEGDEDDTIEEIVEDLPANDEPVDEQEPVEEPIEEPIEEEVVDPVEEDVIEEVVDEEVVVEEEVIEEEEEEVPTEPTAEFVERIEVMARQDYGAENWAQQYCTSHIDFCAPVHRNWWFKSFGATNSALWHVEFSSEPIESLGEGPITLELMAGSIGESDGSVELVDGNVVGYKEWTFGRHFRISADTGIEAAVRYMTENITEFTQ
ncbi:MAG: hypothetical protein QF815_01425 [Candidatus Peribacteraceae bacterium]|jgi:hypothetical protein|nr:hypothetical protein [Candidatus Peribacteraceae bacterium]MDP7477106.1 hypothetical protein [Candidatus Peribacteraceae bacterium]